MGKSDWRQRLQGLDPAAQRMLQAAAAGIESRNFTEAGRAMVGVLALAPRHPEVLRMQGVLSHLQGRYAEAERALRAALVENPDDPLIHNNLGSTLRASGDVQAAVASFRQATVLDPGLAAAWFNLGKTCKAHADLDEARVALERAVELSPEHAPARIVLGDTRKATGDIDGAAASFREAIRLNPRSGNAWYSLANLKTVRFSAEELARMTHTLSLPDLNEDDRIALGFARVKALEDAGRHEDAFAGLVLANARKRRQLSWDAAAFSAKVDALLSAFPVGVSAASRSDNGKEVIFVVSLPRSGSTLVEQILAAHPQVEGASELPDLPNVIEGESRRRGVAFPDWVVDASPQDWTRLGESYLESTRRWRTERPLSTDKGLFNWQYVGAALAMLPSARVVICRRDPLETCLSCFHQLFARGQEYSYRMDELAAYWSDFDRLSRHWSERYPGQVHEVIHEELLAEPREATSRLLAFCGLPFDEACLRFHESTRSVRTASAAQVRQPLRQTTARAAKYGQALAPLRDALSACRQA
ncbi:sulfotransferase [Dokdonella sp.]|uniref:tetratricopeptide repeat-containing sulfotransferase family protein n=1 Tax=Dokdonella sp. TaxID=2291710 RepID=UPI0035281783